MDALTLCPPWLVSEGAAILARSQAGKMPHAVLLTGVNGIGKRAFAQWLAEALLCRQRTHEGACAQCESCRQLLAESHPDYRKLTPEGANAAIKVDPVRALVDWLQLTAGQGSYRVALLEEADTLNRSAANSLLKTLEEPSNNAVLLLSATRIGSLPATVRSRCQKITLKMTDRQAAIAWLSHYVDAPEQALDAAGGGPYAVLHDASEETEAARALLLTAWFDLLMHKGSVGRISDSLSALDTSLCLSMFSKWCLLAVKMNENITVGANPAVAKVISETQDRLNNEQWFTLHARLLQLHRSDSASFKTQTVLEGIFADIRLMTNG